MLFLEVNIWIIISTLHAESVWIPTKRLIEISEFPPLTHNPIIVLINRAIKWLFLRPSKADVGHISTVGQTKKEQTVRLSETLNQGNTEEYLNVTDFDPQLSLIKLQSQTMSMSPTDITWHPTNRPGFMTAGLGVKFKVKQFKSTVRPYKGETQMCNNRVHHSVRESCTAFDS